MKRQMELGFDFLSVRFRGYLLFPSKTSVTLCLCGEQYLLLTDGIEVE